MAIALRSLGQVQVFSSATSSTFTVPKPTGLAVGDFMLASVITNGVGINLPSGWTDLYSFTAINPNQRVFYKVADSTDAAASDFAFTLSAATYGSAEIGAYTGVDTTTPIDSTMSTVESSTNTTTFTVPSATVVTTGAVLVGGAGGNTGVSSSSWTLPSNPGAWADEWNPATGAGGAQALSGGKCHVRANYLTPLTASASTGAITFTLSVSRAGQAWAVMLRPSGGGGAPTPTLEGRVVGVGDSSTGRVMVRTTNTTLARLKVGTDSGLTTGVVEGSDVAPDSDGYAHLTVTGLTAGTKYYYRVIMTDSDSAEHEDADATVGVLYTAPSGAASFSVDFSSCCDSTDSTAFDAIYADDSQLFLHLGDFFYADASGTSLANFNSKFLAKLNAAKQKKVYATRPLVYTPSDHDGMNNNTTGGSDATAWANWNTAFRTFFPTPTLPGGSSGCYYTFTWGRVRFIVTDGRTFASNPSATDNSSKTYLGTTQKQWVKDTLDAATELLIVIVNNNPWIGSASAGDDSWLGYTTERTEMANYYSASGKNIIITSGDMHSVAADDGTNSPGGIPVVHGSPLNNTASRKGGPWSQGAYPSSGSALVEQYGRLVFTDNGTQLDVDFTGYSADGTSRITMSKSYSSSVVVGGEATGSFSFSGSATGVNPPPAMPVGDLPGDSLAPLGWKQILAEDWTTDCVEGDWPTTYSDWLAYPDTWDNGHTSYYNGGNSISVSNSILTTRFFTDGGGLHRTETIRPPVGQGRQQRYGVFEIAYRVPAPIPGYKQAFLLWPASNLGADGEIDYPEASFDPGSTIKGFVHEIEPPGSHVNNAYSVDSTVSSVANTWHVCRIVWHDDRVEYWLDGSLLGTGYTSSVNVPDVEMTWRLQTEGNLTGTFVDTGIDPGTTGTLEIAYAAVWTPINAGESTGTISWDGSATGEAPFIPGSGGAVTGSFSWTGVASGATTSQGSATGGVFFAGAATGFKPADPTAHVGVATGLVTWVCAAFGGNLQLYFEPPTHEEPMRTNVRPLNYFRLTYAKSVVRVNGTFVQIRSPLPEVLEAAGQEGVDYFLGGRVYAITDAIAAELTAAGFPVT